MEANQKKTEQSRPISIKQGRLQRRQTQDGSEEGPHVGQQVSSPGGKDGGMKRVCTWKYASR